MNAREELKKSMSELGWSTPRLAKEVYIDQNEDDDQAEISKLAGNIKKELQRKTTKPERFEEYLKVIQAHPDFKRLGKIVPVYVPSNALPPEIEQAMAKISKQLSTDLLDEEWRRDCEE